jgi:hypothetical protein
MAGDAIWGVHMVRTLHTRLSNVSALAIGVVIGAVLLSGVAVAAAPGLVTIADSTGTNKASVNGAGQLLAAESNPRNTVIVQGATGEVETCQTIYTVPAGKALIIKSAMFGTQKDTANPEIDLLKNGCTDHLTSAVSNPSTTFASQLQTWPLGIPVASGKTVDMICFEALTCVVDLVGYLVPSALVPATASPAGKTVIGRGGLTSK